MSTGCGADLARRHARAAIPFLVALACVGCGPDIRSRACRASDTWERQYAIAPSGEVQIVGASGSIVVTASEDESVQVRAERIVRAPTEAMAAQLVSHVGIAEDVSANRVLLRSDGIAGSMPVDVIVNFQVFVPAGRGIRVRAAVGAIAVRHVTGRAVASTADGSITLEDVEGQVEARAENGSIELTLSATADAELDASATNGTIDIAGFSFGSNEVEPRRRLRERLNGGGRLISLAAMNGSVSIRSRP